MKILIVLEDKPNMEEGFNLAIAPELDKMMNDPDAAKSGAVRALTRMMEALDRALDQTGIVKL